MSHRYTASPPDNRFTIVGYSTRVKACDLCGKDIGLSGTVLLKDSESTDDPDKIFKLGSDCAATVTGKRADAVVALAKKIEQKNKLKTFEASDKYAEILAYFKRRDPSGNLKYLRWQLAIYVSGQALENEIADVTDLFHKYGSQLADKDSYQDP